jgi:hypothetical protein
MLLTYTKIRCWKRIHLYIRNIDLARPEASPNIYQTRSFSIATRSLAAYTSPWIGRRSSVASCVNKDSVCFTPQVLKDSPLFCQFEHHVHDFHYLYLPIWALSHACEILSPGLDAVVELQEHRSSEHDSRFYTSWKSAMAHLRRGKGGRRWWWLDMIGKRGYLGGQHRLISKIMRIIDSSRSDMLSLA